MQRLNAAKYVSHEQINFLFLLAAVDLSCLATFLFFSAPDPQSLPELSPTGGALIILSTSGCLNR